MASGKIAISLRSHQQMSLPLAVNNSETKRTADLLLLVLVFLKWMWTTLQGLSHQCFSCNLSSIESIHFLLQFPSFLFQHLLFLLVHLLELLKALMKLWWRRPRKNVTQTKCGVWGFFFSITKRWYPSLPLSLFLSARLPPLSLCWQTFVAFPPLCAADQQGIPSSWLHMSPEGWRSG